MVFDVKKWGMFSLDCPGSLTAKRFSLVVLKSLGCHLVGFSY